jgi:predicted RND superfamily exporter protein
MFKLNKIVSSLSKFLTIDKIVLLVIVLVVVWLLYSYSNTKMNANYSKNRNNYLPSINANEYNNIDTDYTDINLLPTENTNSSSNDMKDELKSFLKKQLNSSDQDIGIGSVF